MKRYLEHPRIVAAIVATLIVAIAFHDVVFLGATLRYSDQLSAALAGAELRHIIPRPDHVFFFGSYSDPGGALWQSEPMMEFVRNSLWAGQSPYWNPYSLAGSVGPETLVDSRLSILSLLYTALGGGSRAFDVLILAGNWIAAFCTFLILRTKLALGILASSVGAFVIIRTGYSTAAGISNVYYSFLLLPWVLYAAMAFVDEKRPRQAAMLALALSAFLSFTFIPTSITSLIALTLLMASYIAAKGVFEVWKGMLLLALSAVLVIATTSYLYWPIFIGIGTADIAGEMSGRVYFPAYWSEWLGLFTSSHFFESYQQKEPSAFAFSGFTVYHLGVAPLILAGASLGWKRSNRAFVIGSQLTLAFFFARIFGVPLLSDALNALPLIPWIGSQYWWTGAVLSVALLAGFGIQTIIDRVPNITLPVLVTVSALASAIYLSVQFGISEPNVGHKYGSLAFLAILLLVSILSVLAARRAPVSAAFMLVCAVFAQLTWDAKTYRFAPQDEFVHPTAGVRFLQENAGLQRTLTIGLRGAPMDKASAVGVQELTSLNMGALHSFREFFNEAVHTEERWGPFLSLGNVSDGLPSTRFDFVRLSKAGMRYLVVPTEHRLTRSFLESEGFSLAHESDVAIYENPSVYPRVYFAEGSGTVEITDYENTRVEVTGSSLDGGVVVLTDNIHPFWRATVNNTDTELQPIYGTFRQVSVPPADSISNSDT